MNFTVLMSLYIKEKPIYLEQCLQSLQKQTIQANEIVIVLDGPITKALEETIAKWMKKIPIRLVPLDKNIGLGKALNIGLQHSTNEWIFRMDTDDICVPDRFEQQLNRIRENPDTVLLGGQIEEFEDNSDKVQYRKTPLEAAEIYKFAKKRNPFNHMTVTYKKTVIMQLGGYQHHLFMEDYNLWLRVIAKHKNINNLSTILVKARTGDAMLSRRKGMQYIKSEWQLFKLKQSLGFHSVLEGFLWFLIRAVPRLFPKVLLSKIYSSQRKPNE